MKGKASDRSSLLAHEARIHPQRPSRYTITTYAMRIHLEPEAGSILRREGMGGIPNLSNLWRPAHGKRGGYRRRYESYRDAANKPW